MHAISETIVTTSRNGWLEYVLVRFPEEGQTVSTDDARVLRRDEFEFRPPLGPVVISRRQLKSRQVERAENSWSTAHAAPRAPVGQVQVDSVTTQGTLWSVVEGAGGVAAPEALWRIRSTLSTMSLREVESFQFELMVAAREVVEVTGCSWAAAGLAILRGSGHYEGVLNRTMRPPTSEFWEFADLTDIAEEVSGMRLSIADFGSSRSSTRDIRPEMGLDMLRLASQGDFALGPEEWAFLPWRWTSWRVVSGVGSHRSESIVLANRDWGVSLGEVTERVVVCCLGDTESILESVELCDPKVRRPHRGWPPIYYFEESRKGELSSFLARRGLQ